MDDLTMLRELGASLDPAEPRAPQELRHRVNNIPHAPARRGRWMIMPRGTRRGWQLAATGGLAAVLAVGVVAAQLGGNSPRGSGGDQSSAQAVLRLAAQASSAAPALAVRPDQFVFTESQWTDFRETIPALATPPPSSASQQPGATSGPPTAAQPVRTMRWLSVDGTREGLVLTAGDAAPPPAGWLERRVPERRVVPPCDGSAYGRFVSQFGNCQNGPAYQPGLPDDPDVMADFLRRTAVLDLPSAHPRFIDLALFQNIRILLEDSYLDPAAQSALFQAIAELPRLRSVGQVTDAAGRSGVAVAVDGFERKTSYQLVFEPQTGALLSTRTVAEAGFNPALPAGTVLSERARLRVAIVDQAGQLPA